MEKEYGVHNTKRTIQLKPAKKEYGVHVINYMVYYLTNFIVRKKEIRGLHH